MPKKTINDLQSELDNLRANVDDLREENTRLYRELKAALDKKSKPWYTSAGIWLAILLTLIMIYLVYVFYMSETGHSVVLPGFMK